MKHPFDVTRVQVFPFSDAQYPAAEGVEDNDGKQVGM